MIAGKFCRLLPIRNNFFFPLPILGGSKLRRPAVGHPVRIRVVGIATRAAGESDDYFHVEFFREQNRATKGFCIALSDLAIRMHGVSVAAQSRHLNLVVFELLFPRSQFGRIIEQLLYRTMVRAGITPGANFRGLDAQAGILVHQLIEREIGECGVEYADGNFSA